MNMPGVFKTTVPHMSDLKLRNEHAMSDLKLQCLT